MTEHNDTCEWCNGSGEVTVRTSFPMSYVCAGEPPEEARGVVGIPCGECDARHADYRNEE